MSMVQESRRESTSHLASLPRLGVGLSFQATLWEFLQNHADAFDFVEIIPDSLWTKRGVGTQSRYEETPNVQVFLEQLARVKPLVAHSIGLSIGSADRFATEHVVQIATWQQRYDFPWHSDHLSFNRLTNPWASGTAQAIDVGFTMPLPYDHSALEMVVERVRQVQQVVQGPFLLENNVVYFNIPHQDMDEATFLNALTARTGCGLLLDLHNVYANARNHGFDPWDFLSKLDLTRVVEIHLAGGMTLDDFYLDAHSGVCPEAVWGLLEGLLPQVPNLAGIVFEVFGTYYPAMGPDLLRQELERARELWDRR